MIFAVVETTDTGGVLQVLLFEKRKNAETIFKKLIEKYCAPEDAKNEIDKAIDNGWSWNQVEIHQIKNFSDDLVKRVPKKSNE